jgi:hypothetical protein
VADGVGAPEVPGLSEGVPLAGWVASEADGAGDRVADTPGAAPGCAAVRLAAAFARAGRDGVAFVDGVLLPDAGAVVAGEDIAGVGDVAAVVAVGAGDAVADGASRWQAAMTTMFPDCAALPPTPLTSAK